MYIYTHIDVYLSLSLYIYIYNNLCVRHYLCILYLFVSDGPESRGAAPPATCKHGWSKHGFSRITSKHPQIANSIHIYYNHV